VPRKSSREGDSTYRDKLSRIRKKASRLAEKHGLQEGYRSGLEVKMGLLLQKLEVKFRFEDKQDIIEWVALPTKHKYHPDFVVIENAKGKKIHLILETKGRFMPDDMQKHLAIKIQNPHLDIRFVFQNSAGWHRRAVKMTYAGWCDKHNFRYCDFRTAEKTLERWLKE
jgi:hypothetical protein